MAGPNYAEMPDQSGTDPEEPPIEAVESSGRPTHVGGGWYELSDGTRVQGKVAAMAAEAAL